MAVPVSRLGRQIAEVTTALRGIDAQLALIGGLTLAIEELCQVWPSRPTFTNESQHRF